ncbi:transposase [bacterium]|nr:transposase [bacterium]
MLCDSPTGLDRQFSPEYKAKAALEAINGQRTLNEIAGDLEVHPIQLGTWKKTAVDSFHTVFAGTHAKSTGESEALVSALYQEIGQLKMELDWLKKKSGHLSGRPALSR